MFSVKSEKKWIPDYVTSEKSLSELVKGYEKNIIEYAIKNTKNVAGAAKILKISRQALKYKLSKYNIT